MNTRLIHALKCPDCQGVDLKTHAFQLAGDETENGMIICNSCHSWYPIVDSIPVVSVTPVVVDKWKQALRLKWGESFDFSSLKDTGSVPASSKAASAQQEQIEFYDQEANRYDAEITDTIFWRSFTKQTVHEWGASEKTRAGLVLEVGCGTGASTVALAKLGCRIVALDICLTAAKVAQAKIRDLGLSHAVDFIVSEAEALPFRPGLFQSCIFSGVLHHVSNPVEVLKQISSILSEGGEIYGHENNASAFRFIFDLLMKMNPLWHEEAGAHPLLESKKTKEWGRDAGLDIRTQSLVFLPPHFFNLFPQPLAETLLKLTNGFFGWIPWLKDQGGLMIISGTKGASV